jgi:hypothetical protein
VIRGVEIIPELAAASEEARRRFVLATEPLLLPGTERPQIEFILADFVAIDFSDADFDDSEDVEKAWMNSPTHKANILNNRYTEIGISTAIGTYKGEKTTFVVQMFGTPKKSVIGTLETTLTPKVAEASEVKTVTEINTASAGTAQDLEEVVPEAIVTGQEPTSDEGSNFIEHFNFIVEFEKCLSFLFVPEVFNQNSSQSIIKRSGKKLRIWFGFLS